MANPMSDRESTQGKHGDIHSSASIPAESYTPMPQCLACGIKYGNRNWKYCKNCHGLLIRGEPQWLCAMCGKEVSKHTTEETSHCHIAFTHRLKELSEGN